MKIIIAGSRSFSDYEFLKNSCQKIIFALQYSDNPLDYEIISGCANGADKLGEKFAQESGFQIKRFPAQWEFYGKSAGFIRNFDMGKYAKMSDYSILIAFWDGKSHGTKSMIDIAKKMKFDWIEIIRYEEKNGSL